MQPIAYCVSCSECFHCFDDILCSYCFLRIGCQPYENSRGRSRENQPMIGGQTFSNFNAVTDWLFSRDITNERILTVNRLAK